MELSCKKWPWCENVFVCLAPRRQAMKAQGGSRQHDNRNHKSQEQLGWRAEVLSSIPSKATMAENREPTPSQPEMSSKTLP